MEPTYISAFPGIGTTRMYVGNDGNIYEFSGGSRAWRNNNPGNLEYGKFADSYLRDVPLGIYKQYKDKLPPTWAKRASHFYGENERVKRGVRAFQSGNLDEFGKIIFESGRSSIEKYETGSPELKALQDIMESTAGIYGGRFSGAGFNGCAMAIVNPEKKDFIKEKITQDYLALFPDLKDSFSIHFCKTADGIGL